LKETGQYPLESAWGNPGRGCSRGPFWVSEGLATRAEIILVVDDDDGVRDALGDLLASDGYEVAVAENGRIALDLLRAELRPCVVILDLMMPIMDAWDFRAAQVQSPELKAVPVIVITAAGFSKESVRAHFGDLPFFGKPPDTDALLATIKQTCGPRDTTH
jgi:DNA-binding NtrC family response regulator